MAKLAQITIGDKLFIEVDADPRLGLAAPIGSFASWDKGDNTAECFFKNGPLNTDWNYFDVGIVITEYLRRDGSFSVLGSLVPEVATNVDLGASLNSYRDVYAQTLKLAASQAGVTSLIASVSGIASDLDLYLQTNAAPINVNSKQVILKTGSVSGTGVRANVLIDAAALDMNATRIINLADPVNAQDAATKNYVQLVAMGLKPKQAVRAASLSTNVIIASQLVNGFVLDGVTLTTGDRVLLKSQSSPAENGIYIVAASGAASRSEDMNSLAPIDEINGAWVPVQEGSQAGKVFVQYGTVTTLGVSAINFEWFDPLKGNDFWIFANSAAGLNTATSDSYFGTKAGNFDLYFYRNNLEFLRMTSTQMLLKADLKFNTGLAAQILNTANLTISVGAAADLMSIALNIYTSANLHQKLFTNATDGDMMKKGESSVKPSILDGDTSKAITYTSLYPSKVRRIKVALTLKDGSTMSCFFEKHIHIDQGNNLVLAQDTFTSKTSGASAIKLNVTSFTGGVLTLTLVGIGGYTGKIARVHLEELAEV